MSRLIRFYPPRWRARYQAEFDALLEEKHPGFGDRLDILRGLLRAWLNPRYGLSVRGLALGIGFLAAAGILLVLSVTALRGTPAEASPRYPVILAQDPAGAQTLRFTVYGAQRTVPHLVLSVDTRRSWLLTGVVTERSAVWGPLRVVHVPEIESSTWRHAWDFGRVHPHQSVSLILDFRVVRPQAFAYSIEGYGALTPGGRPDTSVRLTSSAPVVGDTINFGAVPASRYPFPHIQPDCGNAARHGYHICSSGSEGGDFLIFDFVNDSRPIPHFVLRVDSRRGWTLAGLSVSIQNRGSPRLFTPRRLSAHGYAYTLDFGRLPHGAYLHVHLATAVTGLGPLGDRSSAFANLTPNGQPDPRTLIFTGADSLR